MADPLTHHVLGPLKFAVRTTRNQLSLTNRARCIYAICNDVADTRPSLYVLLRSIWLL